MSRVGTTLIRDDGEQLTLRSDVWAALLHVAAERFAWSPAGTEEPNSAFWREHRRFSEEFDGEFVEWDGDYLDAWGQHVTPVDARSLADSVLRLLEGLPDPPTAGRLVQGSQGSVPTAWELLKSARRADMKSLAIFASAGGFSIHHERPGAS